MLLICVVVLCDVGVIFVLMCELVEFEKFMDLFVVIEVDFVDVLFGEYFVVEVLVVECDGVIVVYVLFFYNYLMFFGCCGFYFEDLYV